MSQRACNTARNRLSCCESVVNAAECNAEMKRGAAGIQEERKLCLVMQKITVIVSLSRSADEAIHPRTAGNVRGASYCHEPYFS